MVCYEVTGIRNSSKCTMKINAISDGKLWICTAFLRLRR